MVSFVLALTLQGTVSFEVNAVRTDALVADLARQSGRALACDAVVASEPVVAQFKGRPIEEVMARLAEVVGGEWVERGGARRLTRSPELRLRQEQEESKKVADATARMLEEVSHAVERIPRFDSSAADLAVDKYRLIDLNPPEAQVEIRRIGRSNPLTGASYRLFAALDPRFLASIRVGARVVLSDRPTAAQTALPPKASGALASLKRDAGLLLEARKRLGPQNRPIALSPEVPEVGPGVAEAGYGKTVFAIKRTGSVQFSVSLTMVGADGRNWVRGPAWIPGQGWTASTPYRHEGPKLSVSTAAAAFASMSGNLGSPTSTTRYLTRPGGGSFTGKAVVYPGESEIQKVDPALSDMLSDPLARDPLGFIVGDFLRQVATERGVPLLATVTDGTIVYMSSMVRARQLQTHEDLVDLLTQSRAAEYLRTPLAEVVEDGGWLVVKPYLLVASRTQRINRAALGLLQRAIKAEGVALLADAARYVENSSATPTAGSLDTLYLSHIEPPIDRGCVELIQSPSLRLLGALTPNPRSGVGPGIAIRDLPPALKEMLWGWINDRFTHIMSASNELPEEDPLPGPLATEPTELYSAGLPTTARVLVERVEAPAVLARSAAGLCYSMSLDSVGYDLASPWSALPRKLAAYRAATHRTYTVRMMIPPAEDILVSVTETVPLAGARESALSNLPETYRLRIEEARMAFGG